MAPTQMTVAQKKQLVVKETDYQLIAKNLYKLGAVLSQPGEGDIDYPIIFTSRKLSIT